MKRTTRTKEQDVLIALAAGHTAEAAGQLTGVSLRTVRRILARRQGRPARAAEPAPVASLVVEPVVPDGATLRERIELVRDAIAKARSKLAPDSALGARLASDAVSVGALLARYERHSPADVQRFTPVELDAGRQYWRDFMRAHAHRERPCARCGDMLVAGAPTEAAPAVAPPPAPTPATSVASDLDAELSAYLDNLIAFASAARDPRAEAKLLREAGRLASVLARLERKQDELIEISRRELDTATQNWRSFLEGMKSRPALCVACKRALVESGDINFG